MSCCYNMRLLLINSSRVLLLWRRGYLLDLVRRKMLSVMRRVRWAAARGATAECDLLGSVDRGRAWHRKDHLSWLKAWVEVGVGSLDRYHRINALCPNGWINGTIIMVGALWMNLEPAASVSVVIVKTGVILASVNSCLANYTNILVLLSGVGTTIWVAVCDKTLTRKTIMNTLIAVGLMRNIVWVNASEAKTRLAASRGRWMCVVFSDMAVFYATCFQLLPPLLTVSADRLRLTDVCPLNSSRVHVLSTWIEIDLGRASRLTLRRHHNNKLTSIFS